MASETSEGHFVADGRQGRTSSTIYGGFSTGPPRAADTRPAPTWLDVSSRFDTAEQHQQELECDRELYQVIALDAKGVPPSRIAERHAASLLAEASQIAKEPVVTADA
ncbi:hypothetical protein M3A49_16655 [Paraburkholderia sp. CNPSo 3076]|uniref:hypothetical protein n=1 Tax=Paraburkholderia sp. CNPSo 3076 TaxID=2940936 RepID=UPI00224D8353|nr:hypothetical protein [Paraburkholderia sp. CNPSo 3076]MCX5541110.1 hypothetical protein [Paraburkholderia sp. CNPSo 3076]